jgi:hypothetical protein
MSAKKPPKDKIGNITPFGLRMTADLKAAIEKASSDNNRSMNAEIVARLQDSFEFPSGEKYIADKIFERIFAGATTPEQQLEAWISSQGGRFVWIDNGRTLRSDSSELLTEAIAGIRRIRIEEGLDIVDENKKEKIDGK